jgi:hypothetical protein
MAINEEDIQQRLRNFKIDLTRLEISTIVQKHITHGGCFILAEEAYFELKNEIAKHFTIHPSEVLVVGSGKTGFSIAPHKRYTYFNDNSDIDLAIVSPSLFDKIWQAVYEFWGKNGDSGWNRKEFQNFLFQGWIRPDKLPNSRSFEIGKDWWEFFRGLTQQELYGPYKVTAGLYKSWYFLENYQSLSVKMCKEEALKII